MLNRYFTDANGYDAIWKDKDDVEIFAIDFSDRLPSGVTISSATVTGDGITIDSSSTTTTKVTFTLSGDPGTVADVLVFATYSDGQKKSHTVKVYARVK